MGVKVEIVRKEMIKPSSPTPQQHKEFKLSFLDQLAPPVYIPLIFFYEANHQLIHGAQKDQHYCCQLLKSSLSLALTSYYPLAGRARDNYTIDCNDDGVLFVEAKVDADLFRVTKNPDMDDLKQLLPLDPNCLGIRIGGKKEEEEEENEVVLAVQINIMDCGGTAIAVQMSHKLADGHSLVAFMKAWAAICCDGCIADIMQPRFDLASLFPPRDLSTSRMGPTKGITMEKIVTKRLVFTKENLENLKKNVAASAIDHPTRVEVVSGHIWNLFLEVMKREPGDNKHDIAAVHAVNLRPRMNPSLPDQAFGNIWRPAIALHETHEILGENGYPGLVGKMRVAIKNVNETFVTSVQKGDDYLREYESFQKTISQWEMEVCRFSSWSRFPMYEVDYGWGKPVWVSTTTLPFKNVAILLNTNNGDGIEVWINLLEKDASMFETDYILNLSHGG